MSNNVLVVDQYTSPWGSWSPHSLNFMLFTSVWTLLAVAFLVLVPTRFPRAAHKFVIGGLEALTMIFWFAAFVAVAVLWSDAYWGPRGTRKGTFYGCGVAAIVFSAILWSVLGCCLSPRNTNVMPGLPLWLPPPSRHSTSATPQPTIPRPRRIWLLFELVDGHDAICDGNTWSDLAFIWSHCKSSSLSTAFGRFVSQIYPLHNVLVRSPYQRCGESALMKLFSCAFEQLYSCHKRFDVVIFPNVVISL